MDKDINLMNTIYKYIIGEDDYICRLCLASVETESISLNDATELKRSFIHEMVTFHDMLIDLGVQNETSLPRLLCKECATTVINAYLFKRLIPYYREKWFDTLTKVSITLEPTISMSARTVFFFANENRDAMLTSRTTTECKRRGLRKLTSLIKYKKRVKVEKTVLLCNDCGETFKSNQQLSRHRTKVHSNNKYECSMCPKVVASEAQLQSHIIRLHHPKIFKCPKCDKMFTTEKLVAHHDRNYHIAVICKLCFVQFPSKRELKSHLDKHDVQNCPKCGKLFYSRQVFRQHEKICGSNKVSKFFCDICSKGYAHKKGILTHLKVEHGFGVNLHQCKWCNKKFDAASKLKMHTVVHTRERNYHCDQCGNKFVTPAALVYHTRLHTGERPFPCNICGERFLSASRRMAHVRKKHIGPTEECPICHVKFMLNNQLKKHIQRHYNPESKLFIG